MFLFCLPFLKLKMAELCQRSIDSTQNKQSKTYFENFECMILTKGTIYTWNLERIVEISGYFVMGTKGTIYTWNLERIVEISGYFVIGTKGTIYTWNLERIVEIADYFVKVTKVEVVEYQRVLNYNKIGKQYNGSIFLTWKYVLIIYEYIYDR